MNPKHTTKCALYAAGTGEEICSCIMLEMGEWIGRAEKAEAELVQTRASLASLIASVHVAAMRGWHHTQIAAVEEAADHAQSALPEGSASDSVSEGQKP